MAEKAESTKLPSPKGVSNSSSGGNVTSKKDAEKAKPNEEPSFSDSNTRREFVSKVYAVLSLQVAFITIVCAYIIHFPETKNYLYIHSNIAYGITSISCVIFIVLYLGVCCCCRTVMRTIPFNLIIIGILTLCIAAIIGMGCIEADKPELFELALLTITLVSIWVTIFSATTSFDLTSLSYLLLYYVCVVIISVALSGLGIYFLPDVFTIDNTAYSCAAVFVFTLYVSLEVKCMISCARYEVTPSDHLYAVFMIFADITFIFWCLIECGQRLLSPRNSNKK